MPKETKTTWTCSRCGREQVHNGDYGPAGWRLVMVTPYEAGLAHDRTDDLCPDCRAKLTRFLEGAELIPERGVTMGPALLDGMPQEHVGYWDSAGYLPLGALPVHRDDQIRFFETHRPIYAIDVTTDARQS